MGTIYVICAWCKTPLGHKLSDHYASPDSTSHGICIPCSTKFEVDSLKLGIAKLYDDVKKEEPLPHWNPDAKWIFRLIGEWIEKRFPWVKRG